MTLLEAHDINKIYGTNADLPYATALQPTSLEIEEGEFISIVGPSGSGKTTLMSILGLLDRPTSGRLFFEGTDCSGLSDDELARIRNRRIGFVFQTYHLLPRLTVIGNVELPLVYAGISATERRKRAQQALETLGLHDKCTRFPAELSGGEQQRVAIARATVSEPSILLADEPTGALDSVAGRAVIDILKEINRAGRTVVMVTHDSGVAHGAFRKLCMKDGRLVSDGPSRSYHHVSFVREAVT